MCWLLSNRLGFSLTLGDLFFPACKEKNPLKTIATTQPEDMHIFEASIVLKCAYGLVYAYSRILIDSVDYTIWD